MAIGTGSKSVVLVLGMHRSGTSAMAAGLEQLGVVLGRSLSQGDEWNPKGYFEEQQIVEFNNHLLDMAGLRWDAALPPGEGAGALWAQKTAAARDLLGEIFGEAPVWGFKDPRMCLLASFWQPAMSSMGISPRLLLVLRAPAEVANSLARRDGISAARAGWLWFTHLLGSLEYVHDTSDLRLVDFATVLRDPAQVLGSLAQWLDLSPAAHVIERFASDFISPQLSHGAGASSLVLHPLITRAYDYWRAVAAQGQSVSSALHASEWLQIKETFERDIKPLLASVQGFFEGDRQLGVMESRLTTLSRALAATERLALDRFDQILNQDAQLRQTSGALAFAEQLAFQRQAALEQLAQECDAEPDLAKLVLEIDQLTAGLMTSERLAFERMHTIESLGAQLRDTRNALSHCELLAVSRLAEIQELSAGLMTSERLAFERMHTIESLGAQLRDTRDALSHCELLSVSRLAEIQRLDEALKNTARALNEAQKLAFERMVELEKMRPAGD